MFDEKKVAQAEKKRRRGAHLSRLAVLLTVAACAAALFFRTELRARYWAWQIARADDDSARARYLAALCGAGERGRWGISALLAADDPALRQAGLLAAQRIDAAWPTERFMHHLQDPDPAVQELAAVSLAIRQHEAALPALKWLFQTGDESTASAAAVALEQLGTPGAVGALTELAAERHGVARQAALVDALSGIGRPGCVPGLLLSLGDHRVTTRPTRSDVLARAALGELRRRGQVLATSVPAALPAPHTIAERAAAGLRRVTGLDLPFSSDAEPVARESARDAWRAWYADHEEGRRD